MPSQELALGQMGLSEEQADLLDVSQNFCREKSPIEKVRALLQDERGYDPAVWEEIGGLGWLGVAIPEQYGGAGLGLAEVAPIVESMGRTLLNTPYVPTVLAAEALKIAGSEAQKSEWLPKIAEGAAATLALTEADGNWDLKQISARAARSGETLALSGKKRFVQDASEAAIVLVSVLADDKPALLLLERASIPDSAFRREVIIDETKRTMELTLDGLTASAPALLEVDRGAETLDRLHLAANLLSTAEMVGGTKAVMDYTLEYLRTRKQFGQLIGAYQGLKHPMAEIYTQYEQARSHLYAAAHCFERQGEGEIATRMAKVAASRTFAYASDRSIQFHGGFGFTYDCDAQLYRRRAIWHASQYGDEIHHKRALAERLLM